MNLVEYLQIKLKNKQILKIKKDINFNTLQIVNGILLFYKKLNEAIIYKNKGFKSKNNKLYSINIILTQNDINEIIKEIDKKIEQIKDLINEKNNKKIEVYNIKTFVKFMRRFISNIETEYLKFEKFLNDAVEDKELYKEDINFYNKINEQIEIYNQLLDYIHKKILFSTIENEQQYNKNHILFNKEEKKYYNILINLLLKKLIKLNIPINPIIEQNISRKEKL